MSKKIVDNRYVLIIPLLFGLNCNLSALDYNYSLQAGYEDSNNLSQRAGGEEGQATDLGFGFGLSNSLQKQWELDLTGLVSRVNYSEADLADETITNLTGNTTYRSSNSNFSFTSLLDISQAPVNRFQTQEVNNNREQLVYAVMPSYYFVINAADRINTSYTFVDFNVENAEDEQIILPGQAQSSIDQNLLVNYAKRINSTNTLALNARTGKIDFDEDISEGAIDYDRDDYFLSWNVTGKTDLLRFELGRSEIEDKLSRNNQMDYQLVNYTRQLNSTNSLSLSYSNGFNNPLATGQATNRITVNRQNNYIAAAQEVKQKSLQYNNTSDQLSTSLSYTDAEVNQSFSQNNEQRQRLSVNMTYLLSRIFSHSGRSNIRLYYSKSESDFDTQYTDIQIRDVEAYGITFNYVYSTKLAFSLSYAVRDALRIDINNNQFLVDSNSVYFTVAYTNRGRF